LEQNLFLNKNLKVLAHEDEALCLPVPDDVGAVVVGWDIGFNYAKLVGASLCLQRNKVHACSGLLIGGK
jgi:hypothetical protein